MQCILLRIHQYSVCIIYKSCPDIYTADWLSQNNYTKNKGQKIERISINVSVISTLVNISTCTSIEDICVTTLDNTHLQQLKAYIIQGCIHIKKEVEHIVG